MRKSDLSIRQAEILLHKHLTGTIPRHHWETIRLLLVGGYLAEVGHNLTVTKKGREFCDRYHLEINFKG